MANRVAPRLDVYDVLTGVGVVLFEYGVASWSVPAAFVLGGLGLLGLGLLPSLRKVKR